MEQNEPNEENAEQKFDLDGFGCMGQAGPAMDMDQASVLPVTNFLSSKTRSAFGQENTNMSELSVLYQNQLLQINQLILPSEGLPENRPKKQKKSFNIIEHIGLIEKTVRERAGCTLDYSRPLWEQKDTLNPLQYTDLLLDGIYLNRGQIMVMDRRFLEMFLDLRHLSLNSMNI